MSTGKEQWDSSHGGPDCPRQTLLCNRVSGCQCCWAASGLSRGVCITHTHRGTLTLADQQAQAPQVLVSDQTAPPSGWSWHTPNVSTGSGHLPTQLVPSPPGGEAPCAPSHTLPLCGSSGLLSAFQSWSPLGPPPPQLVLSRSSLPCPRVAFLKHCVHPVTFLLRTPEFQNQEEFKSLSQPSHPFCIFSLTNSLCSLRHCLSLAVRCRFPLVPFTRLSSEPASHCFLQEAFTDAPAFPASHCAVNP